MAVYTKVDLGVATVLCPIAFMHTQAHTIVYLKFLRSCGAFVRIGHSGHDTAVAGDTVCIAEISQHTKGFNFHRHSLAGTLGYLYRCVRVQKRYTTYRTQQYPVV